MKTARGVYMALFGMRMVNLGAGMPSSPEVRDRIRKLVQTKDAKPTNITTEIKDILFLWFDNEYENEKRE